VVDQDGDLQTAPPALDVLENMPEAHWAGLLPHLRAALQAVADEALTPGLRRLRAAPTKRLRDGRVRRDLQRALAGGGALWVAFRERLAEDGAAVQKWIEALAAEEPPQVAGEVAPTQDGDLVERLKERARSLRRERDELARQIDGANARAGTAEQARDDAVAEAAALRAELDRRTAEVAAAHDVERAATDRANRRRDREVADLQAQLRDARRALDAARREASDAREALARTTERPAVPAAQEPTAVTDLVPGRPSRLPDDVVPGTTEYARAFLPRGRQVIVDGYNVTRTHRDDLPLAEQREWLVGLLSAAVSRYGIDVTVVFDGSDGAGVGRRRLRGIQVEFSRAGMTADDDICFVVAAVPQDEPLTVVTDDQGLRERLQPEHVDLLYTREFLWAVG
jgi:hypothetical protein